MDIQFLEKNPFFVLDVLPTDKRTTIVGKAEEKAFFLDGNICNEAQMSLLNPAKRLSAEMDWFCECDATMISDIRSSIESHSLIHTDSLSGLARLNATLFNFAISDFEDYFEIGYAILDIDEQYSSIETTALADAINACRAKAGLLPVSDDEIGRELNRKRDQIRRYISDKTRAWSKDDYIELVTILAEKCIADDDYSDGIIISDVVDQYELKMQTLIEEASNEITTHIARLQRIANKEGIETNLAGLIKKIKKWDKLVQPLQLKSMASGVVHQTSENIGYAIRGLSL